LSNDFEHKYKHWHQKISFIKSGIRIASCLSCIITLIVLGHIEGGSPAVLMLAIGLGLAEILGIAEEWI
jgi:ABC-type nickel/cobalt efflux system permease component RcnA